METDVTKLKIGQIWSYKDIWADAIYMIIKVRRHEVEILNLHTGQVQKVWSTYLRGELQRYGNVKWICLV
jgi:hypothetical protein